MNETMERAVGDAGPYKETEGASPFPTRADAEAMTRTLEVVAAEIRAYTASMLTSVIEIGRRLCEAKKLLPYGEFGAWVEANTDYSRSTANNFMRLFEEYGSRQNSLFGAEVEDVQTFGKLSYSKALALLALPSAEREEYVATHDVEAMSTRELQQAIRERDEAKKEAEAAAEKLADLSLSYDELSSEKDKIEDERDAAIRAKKDAEQQVKELESRPVEVAVQEPDPEAVNKAVREAVAEAGKKHADEIAALQKKLDAAKKAEEKAKAAQKQAEEEKADAEKTASEKAEGAAKAAGAETAALQAEVERLRKELQLTDAAVVGFRERFSTWQSAYNSMIEALGGIEGETGDKLRGAVRAMLTRWEEALGDVV